MFTYFTDKSFVVGHMYDMRVCRKYMFRLELRLPISMLTCHNNVHVCQPVIFLCFKHVTAVQYTTPLHDKHWPTLRKVVYESLFLSKWALDCATFLSCTKSSLGIPKETLKCIRKCYNGRSTFIFYYGRLYCSQCALITSFQPATVLTLIWKGWGLALDWVFMIVNTL